MSNGQFFAYHTALRNVIEDNTMQQLSFANLVEQVQHLPFDEKQELWELLENYLREERRNSQVEWNRRIFSRRIPPLPHLRTSARNTARDSSS
jgi:hypothetical protein